MGLFGKTVPKTVDNFKSLCACALPPSSCLATVMQVHVRTMQTVSGTVTTAVYWH